MADARDRDAACDAFLEPQGLGYAIPVIDDGNLRWLLCDDEGEPVAISSLDMIRAIATNQGLVLCSVH